MEIEGELVRVRYPDRQTTKVWELQRAGLTHLQIAKELNVSASTVNTELRLYRETLARDWPISELRNELATLAPKAIVAIEDSLDKLQAPTALRLMEGLGVLNPKIDLRVTQDNRPTEEQLIQVCAWAKDIPVLRLAMLKALGAGDTADNAGPSAGSIGSSDPTGDQSQYYATLEKPQSGKGILSEPDPGTPESSGEEDV